MTTVLPKPISFQWDVGNERKNYLKHDVSKEECEEVFADPYLQQYPTIKHSNKEIREVVVGRTREKRQLFIVFTLRNNLVRIISARDLNKRKESHLYEKTPYSPPLQKRR